MPAIEGTFEGFQGQFTADTESNFELILTKPFVDANELRLRHPAGILGSDRWGIGGRVISYLTRATKMTLGAVEIRDIITRIPLEAKGWTGDIAHQGDVGGGLLKHFTVTFDYERRIMYFK